MPNDAKLGLLVGVAGVFAAAVLFFQDRPPAPVPAATVAPEPPAAKGPHLFGKKPAPKDGARPGQEPASRPAAE